jgi:hypothetical protein
MTTCPYCKKQFEPVEAMMDAEWIEIIKLLPDFGSHGRLVFEYLELFGVSPVRLKSKKILRLLKQVKTLFESGEFSYRKSRYRISKPGIIEALGITCNKNFATPLEDHNYLKKVMITIAEKEEREKSIESEKALRNKEERLINAHRKGDFEEEMTLEEWKKKKGGT